MSENRGTALITGGTRRIGKAIVLTLSKLGYDIALHCHSSLQEAEALKEDVTAMGQKCLIFQADLSSCIEAEKLLPRVKESFPDLSLLVNNASIFERSGLRETDRDLFERHLAVNFSAPFFLTRDFARFTNQGMVINIVDAKASKTFTPYFIYTLTKKALLELTRMSARELAPAIRVNAIGPGLILPPPGEDDDYLDRLSRKIPLKRKGALEDISGALTFFIENTYITGECIYVDGGEHL